MVNPMPLPSAPVVRRWANVVLAGTAVLAVAVLVVVVAKSVVAVRDGVWWVVVAGVVGLAVHGLGAARVASMGRITAASATGGHLDVAGLAKAGRPFPVVVLVSVPSLLCLLVVASYPFGRADPVSSVVIQVAGIGQVLLGGGLGTLAQRAAEGPGWRPFRIGRRR